MENLRSWVALCLMDIFILELVSNRLTVPVKIGRRQEQEENIGAIENQRSMYAHWICMRGNTKKGTYRDCRKSTGNKLG